MPNHVERLPVFSGPPSLTLEGCVGWASDEHEALQLLRDLPETKEIEAGFSSHFGWACQLAGVERKGMILQDDEGPYYRSEWGRYRYQDTYQAFFDRQAPEEAV